MISLIRGEGCDLVEIEWLASADAIADTAVVTYDAGHHPAHSN